MYPEFVTTPANQPQRIMKIITTTHDELVALIGEAVRAAISEQNFHQSSSPVPLSVDQAALYLGLPKSTLYQLTSKREIPFRKVGRRLTFLKNELDTWLVAKRELTRSEIENQSSSHEKR